MITRVWLRAHPVAAGRARPPTPSTRSPTGSRRAGGSCAAARPRRAPPLRRAGVRPRHGGDGSDCVLLVLDEGDRRSSTRRWRSSPSVRRLGASRPTRCSSTAGSSTATTPRAAGADPQGVRRRHDGDRGPWSALDAIFDDDPRAMMAVPHARRRDCHLSHSYSDGACLYFTFAATPPADEIESTYVALWDAGQRAVLAAGGNLSHHHGSGSTGPVHAEALGTASTCSSGSSDRSTRTASSTPASSGCPSRSATPVAMTDRRPGAGTVDACAPARGRARVRVPLTVLAAIVDSDAGSTRCSSSARCSGSCSGRAARRGSSASARRQPRHRHRRRHLPRAPGGVRLDPARRRQRRQLVRGVLHADRSSSVPGSSAGCSAAAPAAGFVRTGNGTDDRDPRHRRRHDRPARRGRRRRRSIVAIEYRPFRPVSPRPASSSSTRRDGGDVLDAAHAVLDRVGTPVDAVGITNQRASDVVWDRATGTPIGPGSAGRTCAPSSSASRPRPSTAGRSPRTRRRRSSPGCSPTRRRSTTATCASARSTAGSPGR